MLLIVGQAPSRTSGPGPFEGASGVRLARMLGLGSVAELRRVVRLANLLPRWPGPSSGKGDLFPMGAARDSAAEMLESIVVLRPGALLLAGRKVAEAFRCGHWSLMRWHELYGVPAAVFPHPSGLSRWWNDARNRDEAEAFLRGALLASMG